MLSETSQSQRSDDPFPWHPQKGKTTGTKHISCHLLLHVEVGGVTRDNTGKVFMGEDWWK